MITYQVYRGWLTRGLGTWELNKVILSDSFGESFSICKNIELESGIPVEVTLYPGDCHEEELLFAATSTTTTTTSTTKKPKKASSSKTTNNKSGEIIELGKHIIIDESSTNVQAASTAKSLSIKSSDNWKPIETTQSIKKIKDTTKSSSSISTTESFLNIGERMPKKAKTEKRSFGEMSDEEDIIDRNRNVNMQVIRDDSASLEEVDDETLEDNVDDIKGKFITVQLFPYRLGDIFEKAEKYARNTLFPLLSEQISNIFNTETNTNNNNEKASNAITIASKSPSKSTRKFEENDLVVSASSMVNNKVVNDMMTVSDSKNTVQTLQKLDKSQLGDHQQHILHPPIDKLFNTNSNNNNNNDDRDKNEIEIEKESVKINLPTYKPPSRENDKIFIPIDRESLIS